MGSCVSTFQIWKQLNILIDLVQNRNEPSTEKRIMVGTWLREISSCSSLTVLSGFAWVLLNKIYQPFFTSLDFNPKWPRIGKRKLFRAFLNQNLWTDHALRHVLQPGTADVPLLDPGLRRHLRQRRRLLVPLHHIQLTTGQNSIAFQSMTNNFRPDFL